MCIIAVSALAAEWIEIGLKTVSRARKPVSALAAEWIEIAKLTNYRIEQLGLRPRGGVD